MRTLVVGAGATGGYFGGRLLEAGCDVTFLVRPARAAELASRGLQIRSQYGDANLAAPPTVLAEELRQPFDMILLSSKAYDLDNAMASFAPAVGPETAILPLLNGMQHLETLGARFSPKNVLGGVCLIAATLDDQHEIVHLNDKHGIVFGELDCTQSDRVKTIAATMEPARFDVKPSPNIVLEMWEKWVFLASLAGATCLMRASIGDIVASPGGLDFINGLLEECLQIATAEGNVVRESALKWIRGVLTAPGSPMTASMFRDVESNSRVEADHVVGDLLRRGREHGLLESQHAFLAVAYTSLKAYEARRSRTASA